MITRFNYIKNFGAFVDFDWSVTVRCTRGNNVIDFKKLNIIFGRNYSGKTTLSRILRCYKKRVKHEDYRSAQFSVTSSEFGALNEGNLSSCSLNIKVYNSDFVNENLQMLRDKRGQIQPFAIVGSSNIEIEARISSLLREIGDDSAGLTKELNNLLRYNDKVTREHAGEVGRLEDQFKEKARQIKNNATKFNVPTYNINSVRQDIGTIARGFNLSSAEEVASEQILLEEMKPDVEETPAVSPRFWELHQSANDILGKIIKPSKSIQELLENSDLQKWVRDGIVLHRDGRDVCAFCGSELPDGIWDRLDAHFSKESEEYMASIGLLIGVLEEEIARFDKLTKISESALYSEFRSCYSAQHSRSSEIFEEYIGILRKIIEILLIRKGNVFKDVGPISFEVDVNELVDCQSCLNAIVKKNNSMTAVIDSRKQPARRNLRLQDVKNFIGLINLANVESKIESLEAEVFFSKKLVEHHKNIITVKRHEVSELNKELSDERKGAEQVNEYLQHYFGHNSLSLVSESDDDGSRFVLMRGAEKASNLSEGECSLVAFCYFMAKLKEMGEDVQNTLIWIDDPISSLDSNHIFFVFSLIESLLAKDGNYKQLFISTHSLDFLKYLKRISHLRREAEYFIVENDGRCSKIRVMPEYLKEYVTEFNYLFKVICRCAASEVDGGDYDYYYNFGNSMRKFLEAYLFYKYPNNGTIKEKMGKFFEQDNVSVALSSRVENEFSHLEHIFDRSTYPIDVPEMQRIAKYVLNKIKNSDIGQYEALLLSVSVDDPLPRT